MRLRNKVALITGAASGMGLEEAKLFALEGAKVIVADTNREEGTKIAADIWAGGCEAVFIYLDITSEKSIKSFIDELIATYGQLDVVVNNAGIFDGNKKLLDTDESRWDGIFNVNLKGMFLLSKYTIPYMLQNNSGVFVNIASIAGLIGGQGGAAYTAAKHGVIGLTKHIAAAYGEYGIRANVICPGLMDNPLIRNSLNISKERVPMRRLGKYDEVANLALFLASNESSFINGAVIPIDGGYTSI